MEILKYSYYMYFFLYLQFEIFLFYPMQDNVVFLITPTVLPLNPQRGRK